MLPMFGGVHLDLSQRPNRRPSIAARRTHSAIPAEIQPPGPIAHRFSGMRLSATKLLAKIVAIVPDRRVVGIGKRARNLIIDLSKTRGVRP